MLLRAKKIRHISKTKLILVLALEQMFQMTTSIWFYQTSQTPYL